MRNRFLFAERSEPLKIQLVDRDIIILNEITKWRFLLSRQIRILCEFQSQRTCDRRLKKLIEAGYIERKKILYGIPSLYFVTDKARKVFGLEYLTKSVRVEQIIHDITVIDTMIYMMHKNQIDKNSIISEREMKNREGFSSAKHLPDFIYKAEGKIYCVEIELSVKGKNTLLKNVRDNYKYELQKWYVDKSKIKISQYLNEFTKMYDNIEIFGVQEVREYVKTL